MKVKYLIRISTLSAVIILRSVVGTPEIRIDLYRYDQHSSIRNNVIYTSLERRYSPNFNVKSSAGHHCVIPYYVPVREDWYPWRIVPPPYPAQQLVERL